MTAVAPTVQAFFTERLIGQRQASPHIIAAYRDTLRLLHSFTIGITHIVREAAGINEFDPTAQADGWPAQLIALLGEVRAADGPRTDLVSK